MTRLALVLLSALARAAIAQTPPTQGDARCCVVPVVRDKDGTIHRSAAVIAAFRSFYACPSTGQVTGACPGWAVDHVIPLACGGRDAVYNMQWLPLTIKSAAGKDAKDRWERTVYCGAHK
jgi:5-methylcytosine-specific restriction endonuclease McrA